MLNRGFMDSTAASANPCSAGTAALALPKSRLLRAGPLQADNGTKRLCPSPTPQGGACAWAAPEQDLPRLWLWEEQGLQNDRLPGDWAREVPARGL